MPRKPNYFQNAIDRIRTTESWDPKRNPRSGAVISDEWAAKIGLTSSPEEKKSIRRQEDSWQHVLEQLIQDVPSIILNLAISNESKQADLLVLFSVLHSKLVSSSQQATGRRVFLGNDVERNLYVKILGMCIPLMKEDPEFMVYVTNLLETSILRDRTFLTEILRTAGKDIETRLGAARVQRRSAALPMPATAIVTSESQTVNASILLEIIGKYKSSSVLSFVRTPNPGPEFTALKGFLSGKKDDEQISVQDIYKVISGVSSQSGSKAYRAELLLNPSCSSVGTHSIKDDTGVDKVIRELGRAFLPTPAPAPIVRR